MRLRFLTFLYTFISITSVEYVEAQSLQRNPNILSPNDGDVIPLGGTIEVRWQNFRWDKVGIALINRTFDPIITPYKADNLENSGAFNWGVLTESDTFVMGTYTIGLSDGVSNNIDDYQFSGVFSFVSPSPSPPESSESTTSTSESSTSTSTSAPSATGDSTTSNPQTSTTDSSTSSSIMSSSPPQSSSLSPGAIAGTVVGSVALFMAGALIALWIIVRERRKRLDKVSAPLIPLGPDDQPRWDDGNAYFQNTNKARPGDGWMPEVQGSTVPVAHSQPQELEGSRGIKGK